MEPKIIFATGNENKMKEIRMILADLGMPIVSMKEAGIDLSKIEEASFDDPMGDATGAGAIFGTTGGVMEAALRTAADTLEGKDIESLNYEQVRGEKGIKEATLNIAGNELKVVVASGLAMF